MNVETQNKSIYSYIGQRIKERRKLLQLNQTQLAEMMGFSYQQMQKYETGNSQISTDKLLLFAKVLNVPPSYFYEGIRLDETIGKRSSTDIIQRARSQPLRILLIEDNPADVLQFTKALAVCSERTQLHIIHEADAVMDYLHHHHKKFAHPSPELIVLDLSMPKLNGMEILKFIKKNPKMQTFPVIILTNSISVKDMMDAYRNGASGFIQKSIDFEEYTEAIDIAVKYWAKAVILPRH